MTDVEIVKAMAPFESYQHRRDALTRAADALAREPALMRVVSAARALMATEYASAVEACLPCSPQGRLSDALRALDEVGR